MQGSLEDVLDNFLGGVPNFVSCFEIRSSFFFFLITKYIYIYIYINSVVAISDEMRFTHWFSL